jgi:galactokinase
MDTVALTRRFQELFDKTPGVYRAPGRVNLIGEHTDYNEGFVMPAAVGLYCWVAIAPRSDRHLLMHSSNFGQSISVNLDDSSLTRRDHWTDYIVGTAKSLEHSGYRLRGADILVYGEVPFGSGLSSSAAIEVACGYAFLDLSGAPIDMRKLALACQFAENEFVGARCGIMDQFISAHGRAGHALMLDCRSLESQSLPLPDGMRLVVCNTGVKHSITGGEYNERRAQCEQGVHLLSKPLPGIQALRDVTSSQLEEHKRVLPELIYRRCRHVIRENERVQLAAEALDGGNFNLFRDQMTASHCSLRDDFEVSCPELDIMVEIAAAQTGMMGARMTGGGFGGCTVNLVESDAAQEFAASVGSEYERRTGIRAEVYVLQTAEGVHRLEAAS